MDTFFEQFWDPEAKFHWTLLTVLIVIGIYQISRFLLKRKEVFGKASTLLRQVVLTAIILTGIVAVLVSLPINDDIRTEVISVFGIVLSAAFALSSTTLLSNVLAGLVNRITRHFEPGDYVRINEHFGRVTDAGLFHVEMQMENRNLVSFPHQYMTTHPIEVIRDSGTILKAEVSLGYDVPRYQVETLLIEAAKNTGLNQPFVFVTSLGDYSIVYEVHGLCNNLDRLVSTQSKLYAQILDVLHVADIEIMSPTFVNQRIITDQGPAIPEPKMPESEQSPFYFPEEVMFEKGLLAKQLQRREEKLKELTTTIEECKKEMTKAETDEEIAELEHKINRATGLYERIEVRITILKEKLEKE